MTALDLFAKLFNTGHRRPTSKGDEYRGVDLDRQVSEARKLIVNNCLPLEVIQNNSLTSCRAFLVKEVA